MTVLLMSCEMQDVGTHVSPAHVLSTLKTVSRLSLQLALLSNVHSNIQYVMSLPTANLCVAVLLALTVHAPTFPESVYLCT